MCVHNPDDVTRYAGFAHRREFVHKALEVDSTSNWLNGLPRINVDEMTAQLGTARPLHAAMLPDGAGVHEFEAKPSFSFAAAKAGLNDIAYTMANKKLRDPMCVHTENIPSALLPLPRKKKI